MRWKSRWILCGLENEILERRVGVSFGVTIREVAWRITNSDRELMQGKEGKEGKEEGVGDSRTTPAFKQW